MAKRNTVSGISINSTYIAFATVDIDEGVVINMSIQPLDIDIVDNWERIEEGMDTLFDGLKLKGENIAASIPAEHAIVKVMDVDPLEEDVDEFLSWELSQQIVGNLDDYVFDYERISIPGEAESNKFFITAYRKNAVDKLVHLLKSKKQHPVIVEPDAFSLINLYELNYKESIADPTLIIYSEDNSIKVILTKDGHYIDMDCRILTEESIYDDELKDICNHISSTNRVATDVGELKVYYSGSDFENEENISVLRDIYSNAEIISPFNKIKNLAGWNDDNLQLYMPRLAVAVGLAIRDADQI